MPSSTNRKRIEIPSDLYDQLATRAEQHDVPVSALATFLLLEALHGPPLHPSLEQRLAEILTTVRALRDATTEQQHAMRSVQDELGETREYMLLRFPEGMTDVLKHQPRDEPRLRSSRRRLIEQLRSEHWRETTDAVAEVRQDRPERGDTENDA